MFPDHGCPFEGIVEGLCELDRSKSQYVFVWWADLILNLMLVAVLVPRTATQTKALGTLLI